MGFELGTIGFQVGRLNHSATGTLEVLQCLNLYMRAIDLATHLDNSSMLSSTITVLIIDNDHVYNRQYDIALR